MMVDGRADRDLYARDVFHQQGKDRSEHRRGRARESLLSTIDYENGYSLYVGIPFCPTTCLYCSFTSFPIVKWEKRMDLYKEALFKEMEYVAEQMKDRPLSTIYFGGGTPTSLNPQDLDEILTKVEELFPWNRQLNLPLSRDVRTASRAKSCRCSGITEFPVFPSIRRR